MFLPWCLDGVFELVFSHSHLHVQQSDSIDPALIHWWLDVSIDHLVHLRDGHVSDLRKLVLPDAFADFLLEEFILLGLAHLAELLGLGLAKSAGLEILLHGLIISELIINIKCVRMD